MIVDGQYWTQESIDLLAKKYGAPKERKADALIITIDFASGIAYAEYNNGKGVPTGQVEASISVVGNTLNAHATVVGFRDGL